MKGKQTIYTGHKTYIYVQQKKRLFGPQSPSKAFMPSAEEGLVYFKELEMLLSIQ